MKLTVAVLVSLIPILAGLAVITVMGRRSDRARTIDLITEHTGSVASDVTAFFNYGVDMTKHLAILLGSAMIPWDGGAREVFEAFRDSSDYITDTAIVLEDGSSFITSSAGNPWQGGRLTVDDADPNADPILLSDRDYYHALVANNPEGRFFTFVTEPYTNTLLAYKRVLANAPIISGRQVARRRVRDANHKRAFRLFTARLLQTFTTGSARMPALSKRFARCKRYISTASATGRFQQCTSGIYA